MKGTRIMVAATLVAGLAAAPLSSASAHRHHGFPLFLPFVAAGAVVGAAAAIATAPIAAVAGPPAYYPPPPAYYPPAPAYYAPPPPYYGYGYYR